MTEYVKVPAKYCGLSSGRPLVAGDLKHEGSVSMRRSGRFIHVLLEVVIDGKLQQVGAMIENGQ